MLNIAVIGCGYWGPNLVRNFYSLEGCRVKYVCDVQEDRLAHLKRLYPDIETVTDFNYVIDDPEVDAVTIATPVGLHYELAKKSLEAGKHTFIEKPMAATVAECKELI